MAPRWKSVLLSEALCSLLNSGIPYTQSGAVLKAVLASITLVFGLVISDEDSLAAWSEDRKLQHLHY